MHLRNAKLSIYNLINVKDVDFLIFFTIILAFFVKRTIIYSNGTETINI